MILGQEVPRVVGGKGLQDGVWLHPLGCPHASFASRSAQLKRCHLDLFSVDLFINKKQYRCHCLFNQQPNHCFPAGRSVLPPGLSSLTYKMRSLDKVIPEFFGLQQTPNEQEISQVSPGAPALHASKTAVPAAAPRVPAGTVLRSAAPRSLGGWAHPHPRQGEVQTNRARATPPFLTGWLRRCSGSSTVQYVLRVSL